MPDLLERLVALEDDVRYRERPTDGEPRIGSLAGSRPVLLSAPHGAIHTRQGKAKEEEEFTAAVACLVAKLADAHALYIRRWSPTDPNWDADVPYKRRLKRIVEEDGIRFVFDIHGIAPNRLFGIALGTMEGQSCPDHRAMIVRRLEACGFGRDRAFPDRLDVDQTFTGRGVDGQETVTAFASQQLGVPAAQLEVHPLLRVVERREDATLPRPFHGDPERIQRFVEALGQLVDLAATAEPGIPQRAGARLSETEGRKQAPTLRL